MCVCVSVRLSHLLQLYRTSAGLLKDFWRTSKGLPEDFRLYILQNLYKSQPPGLRDLFFHKDKQKMTTHEFWEQKRKQNIFGFIKTATTSYIAGKCNLFFHFTKSKIFQYLWVWAINIPLFETISLFWYSPVSSLQMTQCEDAECGGWTLGLISWVDDLTMNSLKFSSWRDTGDQTWDQWSYYRMAKNKSAESP